MMKKGILLLLGCGLVACGPSTEREPDPTGVKVVCPERAESLSERQYTFISRPYRTSELSFRVGGPVRSFDAQNGQFFRQGELIAAIDDRDFQVRHQRAKAIYGQAEADYRRIASLYGQDNISAMSYEKAKADFERAKADLETAANSLADTRLLAPFDGYVQQVGIERFQEVKPSFPVVTLIDLSRIKLEASVPEAVALESLKTGRQPDCAITFEAFPGERFSPSEVFLTRSATQNNISYQLTAIVDNPSSRLMGGMAGTITLPYAEGAADADSTRLSLPLDAICHDPVTGSYVWRVGNDDRVNRAPVVVGQLMKGNRVEILSGVSASDRVAVTRLAQLSENENVTIQP